MAKIMLPYLNHYKENGRSYAYYRRAGRRLRIRGEIGSAEFLENYAAAERSFIPTVKAERQAPIPGSFQALWNDYAADPEFTQLAIETRKDYTRLLQPSLDRHGHRQIAGIHTGWVLEERKKRAKTPSRANRFVAVLKLLLNWGYPHQYRPRDGDPTKGIKPLRTGKGHRPWIDSEVDLLTSPAAGAIALPVLIGRHLGQRLQDIIPLTWSAYYGQTITVTQRKSLHTEEPVTLVLPVPPALKKALDKARRARDLEAAPAVTICTRPDGKPWQLSHFKHVFTATRRKLGLPEDLHFHGLRYTRATEIAEKGGSNRQIRSIIGHKTDKMANKYSRRAEQKAIAESVIQLFQPKKRTRK